MTFGPLIDTSTVERLITCQNLGFTCKCEACRENWYVPKDYLEDPSDKEVNCIF